MVISIIMSKRYTVTSEQLFEFLSKLSYTEMHEHVAEIGKGRAQEIYEGIHGYRFGKKGFKKTIRNMYDVSHTGNIMGQTSKTYLKLRRSLLKLYVAYTEGVFVPDSESGVIGEFDNYNEEPVTDGGDDKNDKDYVPGQVNDSDDDIIDSDAETSLDDDDWSD